VFDLLQEFVFSSVPASSLFFAVPLIIIHSPHCDGLVI
jgi:hypothetical protein